MRAIIVALLVVLVIAAVVYFLGTRQGGARNGFVPSAIDPCVGHRPTPYDYGVWDDTRNQQGTVARVPYSVQSKVSLIGGGSAPSLRGYYRPANPITGVGKTSDLRRWEDAFTPQTRVYKINAIHNNACPSSDTIYTHPPGHQGYMVPADPDMTDGTPYQGRGSSLSTKESLTSRRQTVPNQHTASQTGLGTIRRDPRFDPGPRCMFPGGDAIYAHAGHAGGPTFGSYVDSQFAPNVWRSKYVFGFGDAPRDMLHDL